MARTGASRVDAVRIEVTGAAELRKALRRMGADVKDMTKIHREMADKVAGEARGRAPRATGNLARSVKASATQKVARVQAGNNRKKVKGRRDSNSVPYAGPIHFGWFRRNIDPQPFIYDALDRRRDEVVRRYERHVGELVERVGRETP